MSRNPCLDCGACCAFFRVSFYWGETTDSPAGTVPATLTTPISPHHVAMCGTNQSNPRCVALKGEIGQLVHCSVYDKRSSTCREFKASWEDGLHSPDCDKARARYGLPPLQPEVTPSRAA